MQGSISVQSVRGYLALAGMRGLDVASTIRAAEADALLGDIDARVPWPVCERIAGEIVGRIGVAGAVTAMASLGETGAVGVLYYVARHSATVGLAFRRVAQYYVVTSTVADCELVEDSTPPRLELRQRSYVNGPVRGLISGLWAISNAVTLRQMLGREARPVFVELELARPAEEDARSIEDALRCPVRFDGPTSTFGIAPEVLAEPVRGADPVLEAAVVKYADELLGRIEPGEGSSIRGRLRRHLVQSMHSGPVALRAAARTLGTTARTLQRRLHEEGTSFHEVLDELRRDVAITQMRARRKSIDELAFVLGFEKTSSFHRAFKRWTGLTPGEFRRQG